MCWRSAPRRKPAVARARDGDGPSFLVCNTYRYSGHHVGDKQDYKDAEEARAWRLKDPIERLSPLAAGIRLGERGAIAALKKEVDDEVRAAVDLAKAAPLPAADDLRRISMPSPRTITYRAAVLEALFGEMRRDDSVMLIGEDVGAAGGVFKQTEGLFAEFGGERVIDTPISEAGAFGIAVGAAMTGQRPVFEVMFGDFITLVMDQLVNQAAKINYMSAGQFRVPLVLRTAVGIGGNLGPQHSQSLHAWPVHIPGLKVVMPSTPADAKGLMAAAIRDDNPVVFFEDRMLYNLREAVPEGD